MRDFLRNSPSTVIDTCIENLTVLHGTFEWGNSQRIVAILPGVFGGSTAKLPSCQTDIGGVGYINGLNKPLLSELYTMYM
jgi:hypothetical protein